MDPKNCESEKVSGSSSGKRSLNSISFIWYGLLIGVLQGYLIVQNVRRFVSFTDFPWTTTPFLELNSYIALTGFAVLLFPFYLASCFLNFGSILSIPTSSAIHVISSFCLLLPQTLIEAILIKQNISEDSLWKTDMDFMFQQSGNEVGDPILSANNKPVELINESQLTRIFTTISMRPEFFNFAISLLVYSVRYGRQFWGYSRIFSSLFSIQSILNTWQGLINFCAFTLMYKLHVKGSATGIYPFLLDGQITLLLFCISSSIIFFSSCVLYHFGHLRVKEMKYKKRPNGKSNGSGLKYFPHCSAFAVLISLALSLSPLIHDAGILYQVTNNSIILTFVISSGAHFVIWISLWLFLSMAKFNFKSGNGSQNKVLDTSGYSYTSMERVEMDPEFGQELQNISKPPAQKAVGNLYSDKIYDILPVSQQQQKGCLRKCQRSRSFNVRFDDGDYAYLARSRAQFQSNSNQPDSQNEFPSYPSQIQTQQVNENENIGDVDDINAPLSSPSTDSGCFQDRGSLTHSESSANLNSVICPTPYDTLPIPQISQKEPIYGYTRQAQSQIQIQCQQSPVKKESIYGYTSRNQPTQELYEKLRNSLAGGGGESIYDVRKTPTPISTNTFNSNYLQMNDCEMSNKSIEKAPVPLFQDQQSQNRFLSPKSNLIINTNSSPMNSPVKKKVEFVCETPMPSIPPSIQPLSYTSPPQHPILSNIVYSNNQEMISPSNSNPNCNWYDKFPKNQMFVIPPEFFEDDDGSGDC